LQERRLRLAAQTGAKLDANNRQFRSLVENVKEFKRQQR
jgi:hypothetical protein